MENQKLNEKFYEIEGKVPSFVSSAKNTTLITTAQIIIGIFFIYLADIETRWMMYVGYGLFISAICTPISTVCKILANILQMQVMLYKASNNVPDRQKEEKREEPKQPDGIYIGGIRVEEE